MQLERCSDDDVAAIQTWELGVLDQAAGCLCAVAVIAGIEKVERAAAKIGIILANKAVLDI